MLKRCILGIGFVSWMVGITVLSLVSFEDDLSLGFSIPYSDKIVHFTFYFIAGILGILFGQNLKQDITNNMIVLLVFVFSLVGYGIIIEVLQSTFTTNRSGEIMDVMANSAGALLGTLLMWAVFSGKTGLNRKN